MCACLCLFANFFAECIIAIYALLRERIVLPCGLLEVAGAHPIRCKHLGPLQTLMDAAPYPSGSVVLCCDTTASCTHTVTFAERAGTSESDGANRYYLRHARITRHH